MDCTPGSDFRKLINDEFEMPRYNEFRKWFFKTFQPWELAQIKQDFYNDLSMKRDYIPFVKWFLNYFLEKMNNEILVLKSRSWNLSNREIVESIFPPEQCTNLGQNVESTAYICKKN
jgi:hypothetical protein